MNRTHSRTLRFLARAGMVTALVMVVLRTTGVAQSTPVWVTKAPGPSLGYSLGVVAGGNGKIYAIGGWGGSGGGKYDPTNDTWGAMSLYGCASAGYAAGSDGLIYVAGGCGGTYEGSNQLIAYDPGADTWSPRAPMSIARDLLAAAAINGKIYAIGGRQSPNSMEEYNPATDTWTTKTPMQFGRQYFAAVATNGKIYAIGSWGSTMEEYDPGTDRWTQAPCMPAQRGVPVAAVGPDGKIYVIGGMTAADILTSVVRYDTRAKTWETGATPTPISRHQGGAATANNGKIYVMGGVPYYLPTEEYNPLADTWEVTPSDPTCDTTADTTPPVIAGMPTDLLLEATGPAGAVATWMAPTATDDTDGPVPVTCSPASESVFPLGVTTVTWTATDAAGNPATGSFTVKVIDTTPPTITNLTRNLATLWPPIHKMVNVTVTARTSDAVSGTASVCRITGATSSEADNGLGDGDTAGDIGPFSGLGVSLRAERGGNGPGRIYTLTVTCSDAVGNSATKTTTVTVPKSQGK